MPHWTIRWGTTIVFSAVILLFVFSYFYRYPDLIYSEVVVSAANPPAEIKARSTGKITGLFVSNGEKVISGQLLAVIENPARIGDIELVRKYVLTMNGFIEKTDGTKSIESSGALMLGSVQSSFSEFTKLLSDYQNFIQQHFYTERISALEGQIDMQQQLLKRLDAQKEIEEQRMQLASKSYQRDSSLFAKRAISDDVFEQAKSTRLNEEKELETIKTQSVSTQSDIYKLQQEKANLKLEQDNQLKDLRTSLSRAYEMLTNSIDEWYNNFALTSPIEGTTSFNKIWALNQNISIGETLLTIVPENPSGIVGKAYIPVVGAGKVKTGQRVNIKLSNYPYMEYGMVIGTVLRKAPVPVNNFYSVEIKLPDKLITNYGNTLEMQQELQGNCEIITEDLRLIQRIIYPIRAVFEKNRR
jgi:multidrug efflux pump subunit AcrA (membrane-fusion protein)